MKRQQSQRMMITVAHGQSTSRWPTELTEMYRLRYIHRLMKRKSTKANPHHGSSFEAYLEGEGYLEQATAKAIKRVMAWQLQQAMKERKVSKAALAKRLKTSRSQLDRILDPANDQVSLASLVRTAHAVGKRVRFELEEAA